MRTAVAHRRLMFMLLALIGTGRPVVSAEPSCCGPITVQGQRLLSVLDGMNVEALWLAHEHVNWETGEPDKSADYSGPGRSTHCSAFAAAVGKRLGVYMLRPPDHGQILLANAQADWFPSAAGKQGGWRQRCACSRRMGPRSIQAGQKNYTKTSTKVGFLVHPGAWPAGVLYFAHLIEQ
ncbi:MAG TPA: hypothetical protein VJ732_10415 [Bryobacteraceae bacterium]|nr:hypothetical protein [Bryobacteraceae bacterium]